ncbi:MAG: PorT family protein, partial [Bacteroidota bacterium]|nr:PorT family protein [Bacteroidota bacterium]
MKAVGKIFLLTFILLISSQYSYAQKKKIENLPKFDQKRLHFGFTIGINSSDFAVDRVPDFQNFDSLKIVESQSMPGFNLGIIADYHITPVFNLRFIPALSFAQRNLEYTYSGSGNGTFTRIVKPIESTFLDFPLNFKYRSTRLNNFAAYVVGGFK